MGILIKESWESFSKRDPITIIPREIYSSIKEIFDEYNKKIQEYLPYLYETYIKRS